MNPVAAMHYRYPRHRIVEIVQAPKCPSDGAAIEIDQRGEHGQKFDATLDLVDGPFCDLRYLGKAGQADLPATYDASLLLEQQRVRGVGYCPVAKQNFRAKLRIPAGWHQNICDPNQPTDHAEFNRHEPLPDFAPSDFSDYVRRTAVLWNIDLGWEEALL
jgi:hypothetical protein